MDDCKAEIAASPIIDKPTLPPMRYAHTCWNCRSYVVAGLDEPEDKPCCIIDGREVNQHQICGKWVHDTQPDEWLLLKRDRL